MPTAHTAMPEYPQPEIGDRVTYIDNDGERHRALVVDECRDAPYITCVTGINGPLGEEYNHGTDDHSSTFPHTSISDGPRTMDTTAFILGWAAADEGGELEALEA